MPAKKKSPAKSKTTRSTKTKSSASKAKKPAPAKRAASKPSPKAKAKLSEGKTAKKDEVTLERRSADRRSETGEAQVAPVLERRKKVQRRRQIDPTTCERDYSPSEVEFMSAMDDYKRKSGRMFPTCSEVLEVIGALGYVKLNPAELAARLPEEEVETGEAENLEAEDQAPADELSAGWPAMEPANPVLVGNSEFSI